MADGAGQFGFNFPRTALASSSRFAPIPHGQLLVDLFAGGGGASEAMKQAYGRDPDIAINHNPFAIGMHAANHPQTRHMIEDVFEVCPLKATGGQWIWHMHASSDCTHFSQALGGQPRSKSIRSLTWVVLKWAGKMAAAGRPISLITFENVEQALSWGKLIAKRDKATGRVIKLVRVPTGKLKKDGTIKTRTLQVVAAPGERVPVQDQFLVPDKKCAGKTWNRFVSLLYAMGAKTIELEKRFVASKHGAGTSRSRLFMVVRFDDKPISWPQPSHGDGPGLLPFVVAADSIDFSIPGTSIFDRARPLKDKTMRRVAVGTKKFVLDAAKPFFIPLTHTGDHRVYAGDAPVPVITAANRGELAAAVPILAPFLTEHANASSQRSHSANEPIRTVCASVKGGHFSAVSAHVVKFRGDSPGLSATAPVPVITSGAGAERPAGAAHALGVSAVHLVRQFGKSDCADAGKPVGAVTAGGSGKTSLSTAHLAKLRGTSTAASVEGALHTVSAQGEHHALVESQLVEAPLSPEHEAGALRVAAFLIKYYGTANGESLLDPMDTITTRDRLALVTVWIKGDPFVIVDITLRMLTPRELFNAQGFPRDYVIDRTADGRKLTKSQQVGMCGNSVSPPALLAIIRAQYDMANEPIAEAA